MNQPNIVRRGCPSTLKESVKNLCSHTSTWEFWQHSLHSPAAAPGKHREKSRVQAQPDKF